MKTVMMALMVVWVFAVNAQTITGTVVDASDSSPIAGALVTLHGGAIQVVAASDGSFSLDISGTNLLLVGAAKGYYYQSIHSDSPASNVQLALSKVPISDNSNYAFESPLSCGGCHPKQLSEWEESPMAKAGFNSWVNDIYAGNGTAGGMGGFVYTRDSKFASSNPNSECASCHQPQGWVENPFSALDANTAMSTPSVQHGVSCDICHKVADVDESKINFPGIFPGAVVFNRPNMGEQVQYGVLGDVDYAITGMMQGAYQPQMRAELCAVCHQDAADPDENHSYTGVISEPTYLEWKASEYANPLSTEYKDCVDCHMAASSDNQVCTVIAPPDRPVESVRNHRIEGSTAEYLENAVDLNVDVDATDNSLQVNVSVNNNQTGHHVPTGVTVRNMILLVEVWEDGKDPLTSPLPQINDQIIHDLGGVGTPAQGYYAGLPGKFYAKVNHDSAGNGPTFFTDATGIEFDSRIPAKESDLTSYQFELPNYQANIHVRVRLIYRKAFRFLVDAKGWTNDGHGEPLKDVEAPHFGHLMESFEAEVLAGSHKVPVSSIRLNVLFILLLTLMACYRLRKVWK